MKVLDIHKQLEVKYSKIGHKEVAHIIHKAFPNAESKLAGKSHTTHVFGISSIQDPTQGVATITTESRPSPEQVELENKELKERVRRLEARVQELECTFPQSLEK